MGLIAFNILLVGNGTRHWTGTLTTPVGVVTHLWKRAKVHASSTEWPLKYILNAPGNKSIRLGSGGGGVCTELLLYAVIERECASILTTDNESLERCRRQTAYLTCRVVGTATILALIRNQ